MAGRENANESIERDDGELRGADVVYGAAGQPIQRRELLKRTFVGFTVVWVGAQATQAQGGTVKPPVKREPALCGQYNGQTLTGDGHCGIGGAQDRSCGLPITENDWGGPAGQDFQCHAGAIDSDCGKPASSAGHHSDSYCSSYSVDASCGLPYAPGETMADYDCLSVSASDSDCGKPKIGGGTWQDG